MIQIDGSQGEGGGQVLRSALTLSLLTGKDFQITNIRAARSKPGLRHQHLQAVQAAAAVGNAATQGVELGSKTLTFRPSKVRPGNYKFEIGTAGSTSLVLQTIFLPLALANSPSTITITGGTHVKWSPSYHYLDLHWSHFMRQIGFDLNLSLRSAGYYPEGGGEIKGVIHPCTQIKPLNLTERGALKQIRGISAISNLPHHIAVRQREQVLHRMGHRYFLNDIRVVDLASRFKGTMLLLLAEFEHSQACYFSLGELGKPAERVADEAVDRLEEFLSTQGAIDQYLADQILLPLALAGGLSEFSTSKITLHLVTNVEILQSFLPVEIEIEGDIGNPGNVVMQPFIDYTQQSDL